MLRLSLHEIEHLLCSDTRLSAVILDSMLVHSKRVTATDSDLLFAYTLDFIEMYILFNNVTPGEA